MYSNLLSNEMINLTDLYAISYFCERAVEKRWKLSKNSFSPNTPVCNKYPIPDTL